MFKAILCAFTLCLFSTTQAFSFEKSLHALYAHVFGQEEANQEYKDIIHEALTTYGVKDPKEIGIKRMNNRADKALGQHLASFTLFGIWLNEPSLMSGSEHAKRWQLYHEAYHAAAHHHAKALGFFAVTMTGILFMANKLAKVAIQNRNKYSATAIQLLLGAAIGAAFAKCIIEPTIRYQEKQADIAACRALIKTGQQNTVDHVIEDLRSYGICDNCLSKDPWHATPQEQLTYLEQAKEEQCSL